MDNAHYFHQRTMFLQQLLDRHLGGEAYGQCALCSFRTFALSSWSPSRIFRASVPLLPKLLKGLVFFASQMCALTMAAAQRELTNSMRKKVKPTRCSAWSASKELPGLRGRRRLRWNPPTQVDHRYHWNLQEVAVRPSQTC